MSLMKKVAVVGMPNTGKSTLFNRLTGAHASIGNWPGITVDLMTAQVTLGQETVEIIDLPGIYDLRGFSEDEAVVRRFLEQTPLNLVAIILNAAQIDRQISLAIQLQHIQLPTVLLLNMADEAAKFGVTLDADQISKQLGMPVVLLSAKYGQGYDEALEAIAATLARETQPTSLLSLETQLISDLELALEMKRVLHSGVQMSAQSQDTLTTRLDRVLLHPVWGIPIFFGAMFCMFQAVYALGTPLQGWLGDALDWFKGIALEPLLAGLPLFFKNFLIEGLYNGIGTVAAFLPVIFLFFICMGIVEDSGYLSRSAFLMDAFMERLGLDGRSFVMSLMGFGCNVPAIMGTRVMRSPGLRMLSMLVIPFSLCSARLNVFLFMTTALFSPRIAPLVLFSLYLFSFVAAILTALIFKGKYPNKDPMVLELPPYRFPTFKQMMLRSWREVKHFWIWSRKFIIFGVVAIWLLNNLPLGAEPASTQTFSGMIGTVMHPLLAPIGVNPQLTVALIFGFIAKEIVLGGLSVIYAQPEGAALAGAIAHQIDWVQAYSFMLFTLLYVPCLSTVAVIKSESKSSRFALLSVVWSVGLAWVASFLFYQSARLMGF
jgi:ferrous iron transport protein B